MQAKTPRGSLLCLAPVGFLLWCAAEAQSQPPRDLLSAERLLEGGGRVAWSAQGNRLAYDRLDLDGLYDIFIRDPVAGFERCLTCRTRDFRNTHALNPTWHPSGDYIVFQAQKKARRLGLGPERLASPERGLHADLWLIRADGKDYWQLTRVSEIGSAVLEPHFSHDGDLLLWAERTTSRKGRWGAWRLRTAELRFRRGVPRLGKLKSLKLERQGLVLPHEFTPDDRAFLVSAHLQEGQRESGLDIYIIGSDGSVEQRLTRSHSGLDEYARISPSGDLIAYTTDTTLRRPDEPGLRTELWLMRLDGSEKRALTRFNETLGSSERPIWVGDFAWNPAGDRIVVQVLERGPPTKESLFLLELSPSLARSSAR